MDTTSTLVLILGSSLLFAVVQWLLRRRMRFRVFEELGIPGPKPDFVTGNLAQMRVGPTRNDVISRWMKEYGNVFGFFVGEQPFLVIKDLDMLKQIFIKDSHVFHDRAPNALDLTLMSRALVVVKGRRWKEMRNTLTPTFSSGKIKLMATLVEKKVDITVSVVSEMAEKKEMFDIYEVFRGLTLDVIADCALAMKTNCQDNPKDTFKQAVVDYFRFEVANTGMRMFYLFPALARFMIFLSRRVLSSSDQMTTLVVDNIRGVIEARKRNPGVRSMDFLQLLLDHANEGSKNSSKLSEEEIIANAFGFILAGYETTSTALAFTFYLLIKHPDIQEKLYREISHAEDASYNTIQNLKYMDQVLSESLRHYPPLTGFVSRACDRDHQVGGITIPKGVNVMAPVWDIHHDPDLWPDPWSFDPDRFSPDSHYNGSAFLPFGIGARNCIGSRFALLEAKLALFKLLAKFRFEMCEKTDDPITLSCSSSLLNPKNGVFLRAVPRT